MAEMVKRKISDYKLNQHLQDYVDVDMSLIQRNYEGVIDKISAIQGLFNSKMEMMYINFVRKDPFRSYYNY